ncbi:NADH:flavin oxidoreductase/NADH oxidase [Ensifer sp. ENS07]|uniref:NADH:flavin oxidoreductase/NADH oxidase n=1 Tax=Ensifer sp. ENS07 TaxID=2769274 RepID=UPI00177DC6B3|nr:NADH:flavin oxidoreductase/NADH oxidase [Ensifer sp. ENS07]MBD9638773.1 NADH:flavin oxidoreductase/NADH oxidase [Ensifer sp. ENS07]
MSKLFEPFRLKDTVQRNRIAVSPMCQYSGVEGSVTDWHLPHYANLARGGAGLVFVEATAVAPEGRITEGCLGLWSDEQGKGLASVASAIRAAGAVPGIQIAHAGRKASANRPWEGDNHLAEDDPRGWQPIAPSRIAFGANLPRLPREMSTDEIKRVKQDFANAAWRAANSGFEWLELHFAHGYLVQSFVSVHSNLREDSYGGNFAGRSRFPLEIVEAVRSVWPERLPLAVRFGVVEFDGRDEETLEESIQLLRAFKKAGVDLVDVSVGFTIPEASVPWGPSFLVPTAARVRHETGLPVATSWSISPLAAEQAVSGEQLDMVMVGRAHLASPNWTYAAAGTLKVDQPTQFLPEAYAHWLKRYSPV